MAVTGVVVDGVAVGGVVAVAAAAALPTTTTFGTGWLRVVSLTACLAHAVRGPTLNFLHSDFWRVLFTMWANHNGF
jgi:hypothetical protein